VDSITRPDPRLHAEQILLWIICWPWNLVWTLLVHNPLRHIVQFAVVEVRATLEEISSGEFKEIERDLTISEPLPVPLAAATNWLADTSEPSTVQSQADTTRPGPVTRPGAVASNAAPAYVPPPLPAATPVEPDPWSSRADGQAKSAQGGDTAWLQDAWHGTP